MAEDGAPVTASLGVNGQREQRRGKHTLDCAGYNERQCDCGMVDRIEGRAFSAEARISELTKQLNAAVHERDALRERLGVTPRQPERWELEAICEHPDCPAKLRIKVLPPEDALPTWVRGMDWGYTADGEGYLCPEHKP